MRRLDISNIQVDTTLKKEQVIKGSLQIAEEFRGNLLNNEIVPITYTDVGNVFYYDGDSWVINRNKVYKNGTEVFSVTESHLEKTPTTSIDINTATDGSWTATKVGSTITITNGTVTGTITDIECAYDYILCIKAGEITAYVTLFPKTPTHRTDIKSWTCSIVGSTVTIADNSNLFVNPATHSLIVVSIGTLKKITVDGTDICNVSFIDVILSGDNNHVFYTVENNDGYFYSNIEFYDGSTSTFLTTDCMLLATSQDGIYYGGFSSVNNNSGFSIDYFNNVPVQVSFNGKIMANQIDYAYFNSNGNPVIEINDKAYILIIENGVSFSVVQDRYIITNSPWTYNNTYDMETGESFCRNDSYNSRLLWTIDESKLLTDEDKKGTFYVATGVNVQGQTDGKVLQGTIYPSFPVWGLDDNDFSIVDYYGDSSRAIIEVYKGTVETPTVPTFAFCLGGFKDYSGYTYPDSINTLYSVSEIDTFSDTFSGVQVVHTLAFSALTALNNKQNFTFSYYIGTMNELNEVFVLRGTMYGVTESGYIISMTVENGTITSSSVITKKGTMQLIGITQSYALFFSPFEKKLYIFNSDYTLNEYKEFSIGTIIDYSCRAEDNKIAILTDEALYIYSENNLFRIETSADNCKFCKGWLLVGNRAYSSYDGESKLDVEYDTGKQGSTYDTSVQLDEVDVMLDDSDLSVPPYLEYRIDIDDSIGTVEEMMPNCDNIIRLRPTATRNEGLYYRVWLKTNCNILGLSVQDNAEKKPNLTRNNG